MNTKNFYAAVEYDVRDQYTNDGEEPKIIGHYASVMKIGHSDNLLAKLAHYGDIIAVNLCATKKQAEELAAFWNECYKKNGTYAF